MESSDVMAPRDSIHILATCHQADWKLFTWGIARIEPQASPYFIN
jgi:hypothetical protein